MRHQSSYASALTGGLLATFQPIGMPKVGSGGSGVHPTSTYEDIHDERHTEKETDPQQCQPIPELPEIASERKIDAHPGKPRSAGATLIRHRCSAASSPHFWA